MKIYKVNWSIKYYINNSVSPAVSGVLQSKHKYTLDKNKATALVKRLEEAALLLGLTKELIVNVEEMEAEE